MVRYHTMRAPCSLRGVRILRDFDGILGTVDLTIRSGISLGFHRRIVRFEGARKTPCAGEVFRHRILRDLRVIHG